ncbi:photosystem I reaction center subunit PsaK [Microcoleus vaginatus DQ-U2]|uniref:photosystem I reaction center subunit PsaK n=1 Tax=Microcoleus vaginatus TaxID=119532 RepID=UPI0016848071|nr:photosystem I reaction center subunit PsaK [Microcoleus sp. FACHB-DQ6]
MFTPILLATVARTVEWNPTIGLIMILCNILAIAIGKSTIQNRHTGPAAPSMLGGLSLGAVVGSLAFGHILGTGTILGLSYIGAI